MANLSVVYWLKDLSKKGNLLVQGEETELFFEPRLLRVGLEDLTKVTRLDFRQFPDPKQHT